VAAVAAGKLDALIGKVARRFGKNDVISDGQIVGYLSEERAAASTVAAGMASPPPLPPPPPSVEAAGKSDSGELFFFVHFNGSSEVLSREEATAALQWKLDNAKHNPASILASSKDGDKRRSNAAQKARKGEETAGKGESEEVEFEEESCYSSPSSSSAEDDSSFDSRAERKNQVQRRRMPSFRAGVDSSSPRASVAVTTSTLWPSAEARARWIAALQASQTVAEVSFAVSAFAAQAASFGLFVDTEAAERAAAAKQLHREQQQGRRRQESARSSTSLGRGEAAQEEEEELPRRTSARVPKQIAHYSDTTLAEGNVRETRSSNKRNRSPSPSPERNYSYPRRAAAARVTSYAE
jgi:hypothetical protein